MSDQKIIAVIGSTGAQGGGLARAILADPEKRFAARAIARKTGSDKAKALAAAGAEVVAGDADDPASLERAFAGAYGVFCVTPFWEHMSTERELKQAAAMARATKAAGVKHVIWSTVGAAKEIRQIGRPASGLAREVTFSLENTLGKLHRIALGFNRLDPGHEQYAVNAPRRGQDTDARAREERRRFMNSHGIFPPPSSCRSQQDRFGPVNTFLAGPISIALFH